jgi:hypothetical protein
MLVLCVLDHMAWEQKFDESSIYAQPVELGAEADERVDLGSANMFGSKT